jgi:hypothetical protein
LHFSNAAEASPGVEPKWLWIIVKEIEASTISRSENSSELAFIRSKLAKKNNKSSVFLFEELASRNLL